MDSHINKKATVRKGCRIYESSLGAYSYITKSCLVQNTEIGKFCSVSENCYIGMPSHPMEMVSTSPAFLKSKSYVKKSFASFEYEDCPHTIIGNDVWIGLGVMIKSGTKIGDGAVIGAGAVVTRDVEPYAIVAGVPARIIKYRFNNETIKELRESHWWNMTESDLMRYGISFDTPMRFLQEIKK